MPSSPIHAATSLAIAVGACWQAISPAPTSGPSLASKLLSRFDAIVTTNLDISRIGDTPVAVCSKTAAGMPPIHRTVCVVDTFEVRNIPAKTSFENFLLLDFPARSEPGPEPN